MDVQKISTEVSTLISDEKCIWVGNSSFECIAIVCINQPV